jgi:alkanesulfonate monooxygenase SsuD/methylene tetrahydromethanopterin reductase-like flavin-dependent oxidoreductase (luciferase family)
MTAPEAGSISMRLYPHNDLSDPQAIVAELRVQAHLASTAGFDGVMNSEHHGGFAGYSPNPLQVAGWLLDAMPAGWCAPCPMLLPIRPVALVAEEVAWLAARFPGRVAVGVAPGALPLDFEVMGIDFDERMASFRTGLGRLVAMLRGAELGDLSGDAALRACAGAPITVISTAMSPAAVRRAAEARAGVVYDGASPIDRVRALSAAYDDAGGTGPKVLIRRVWLGDPPREAFDRQLAVYRSYTPDAAQRHWRDNGFICHPDGDALADELAAALAESGADVLNLRVQVPGVTPEAAREQISRLGAEVLPRVRAERRFTAPKRKRV